MGIFDDLIRGYIMLNIKIMVTCFSADIKKIKWKI